MISGKIGWLKGKQWILLNHFGAQSPIFLDIRMERGVMYANVIKQMLLNVA